MSHRSFIQKLVSLFSGRNENKNRRVRRGASSMMIEPLERRELLAADLFISEYIEGSSNNKALEIFNDTGAPVNLGTGLYAVQMYFNGNPAAGLTIPLTGTVAQGDVFVLAQSSANAAILAQADQTNGSGWFSGDDAVVLTKNGAILDVIGQIGVDPGTEWGTGLTSTMDNTLRRKAGTTAGDTIGSDVFDPAVQWDGFATDTFDGLGSHAGGGGSAPAVTITATDSSAAETGTNPGTFRISRTGSTTNALTVSYSIATGAGQAVNGTDYNPSLSGTAIIGAGLSFADLTITPVDDNDVEGNETATLTLVDTADYDLGGATIATVTIADNDAAPTRIREIQGAAHFSPLVGQAVSGVSGIVTALASNGLYFQDPNPDADVATSEGIFVFTSSAPTAALGDLILVNGTVAEFLPGGNVNNLTITEIVSPLISIISTGNVLPAAIVLGIGGRVIPTSVIDNDGLSSFNPAEDGIDFYETLEGMLVQINNPVTTSPTAVFGTSEEIWVLADNGTNASGRTVRGGSLITSSDFNPERIQIDDLINASVSLPTVNVGAQLSPISGVVSYDFNNYEVLVATAPGVVQASTLQKEVTTLTGNATQLTVATFNVENLDPGDGAAKFNDLANAIVNNLKSPDIINLEEIQDNNGATNDSVVDAALTLQTLVTAIAAAGGPTYQYRQIDPVDDTNGGEPGGNIRVAFLFNPNRVSFVDRAGGTSTSSTTVTDVGSNGTPDLSASPGLIDPTNAAFNSSRKPIVGEFLFNGQTVFVIGNHFNSKGGDQPLFGLSQPPTLSSEVQRNQQATIVRNFVQSILAINPDANVVVAGDLNDFEFSNPLTILESDGLNTLAETLPANERYTYNFQGNAQVLDHLMVSNSLLTRLNGYDVVHINSEFADQISDHDPSVARFDLHYTLQLLHYYGESGLLGVETAPIMGALIDKFDDQYSNTLKLGEGDTFIPGPWLVGGADPSLNSVPGIGTTALGRPDIAILNAFGTDASALGNHEFDLGSPVLQGALAGSGAWVGAQFPFVTANLNFSADSSLRGLADATIGGTGSNAFAGKEANTIKGKIAPYTVVTEGGEKIGIVGATTYDLLIKSSPNGTVPRDDGNPSTDDLQEVAAYIQAAVNALTSLGVNKILMVDQLDTLQRNQMLAPLVYGIDVMIAGGGHERMGDSTDTAVGFNGHDANFVATYPIVTAGSDAKPTLIVTTDTEFTYLGRLVVDFDANGEIVVGNLDESINGAYASTEAALQAAYATTAGAATIVASSTIGTRVNAIVQAINNVVVTKDSNIYGYTDVYLEGDRVFGRSQEVNLGDISADANLFKARQALNPGVILASLKNGGGIRASIGSIGEDGEKLPPAASGVKPAGAISQLDVENALRFDNKLMVFDTNPQDLLDILNYAAGLAPGNGGYAQIGGVRFSYIPSRPAGQKVVDVAIYDLNDNLVATVVDNGVVLAGAPPTISVAVLNFTANGGDGYPIKANAENFRYLLNDGTLSAAIDEALDFTAAANVPANTLGEQKAFEDFLEVFHSTPQTAYDVADTRASLDQRIQNLTLKADTVFPGVDLSTYVRIGRYDLPEPTRTTPPANSLLAQEVSAVTYNWDTDTLFVVGDGGTSIVQVSKTGQLINSMTLAPGSSPQGTDFYDPEGLTYVGNGKFVMAEERDRQAVLFTYAAGTTLTRLDAQTVKLGTTIGNIGIEGISYDPLTGGFIAVKEALPQGIFQTGIDFAAGTATNGSPTTVNSTNIFDPALANLLDFADAFSLSNLPYLTGEGDFNHILALSQESGKIVEVDRSGNILSSLTIISDAGNPLSVPGQQHEGLTMDSSGYLYVVSENGGGDINHPQLWVYAPTNSSPVFTSGNNFSVSEANTNGVTGPSSSATPYLTSTNPNVQFTSIMTVGDAVNGYRMVGIPDGMGAFDNGDGTLTLLLNHELGGTINGAGVATPAGVIRAHGSPGSFVSRWVINRSTLEVISIQDFLANGTSVYLSNNNPSAGTAHTAYLAAATTVISRLCSADLAPVSAYQWNDGMGTVYGTSARIFQSGEESGGIATSTTSGNLGPEGTVHFGRQFAFVATDDPNTALNEAGTAWELPHGGLFSWENNLANPIPQRKTIVMGMDDGSPTGQVYVWVGDKQTAGNIVERAGLTKQSANDNMYVVKVSGLTPDGSGATNELLNTPLSGTFTLENEGDVSGLTLSGLESLSDTKGATQFFRPEDGQWDPDNPSDFYFVTTSNYDQTKDGIGATIGRSRLYKMSFTDIAHPELGGTITALLDGTEAGNMFDNMTISNGKAIIQEDVGNQQHLGKIWEYNIATDTLTEIAQHDRARFGDVGVAAVAPFSQDEESSGVIDISQMLGAGTYLVNVQAHYNIGVPELVEGGQLLLMRTNVTTGQQFVTTVTATDVDSSPLTFSISGGIDAADFTIDHATGRLSFAVAPNCESPTDDNGDNEYVIVVGVSDGVNPVVTQIVTVTVTDVNESPTNTTVETVSVAENTTAVTTATGIDPESVAVTFAISGGADAGKFTIDQNTGALSFIAAPNFEAPTDNGANNSYFVTVTVADGVNPGVNKTIKVTVTNATELGGIDVQNGQTQRSYLRALDVLFDQSSGLMDLINNSRLQLTQFDLNGQNGSLKSFPTPTVVGNRIHFDFGVQGIGGNRNTNAGDGYYELGVDMDGNGSFETRKYFYRLLGDVNGDRKVDIADSNLTLSAFGTTNPERDVNGDGFVNANDRTLVLRALGRKLKDDLFLND